MDNTQSQIISNFKLLFGQYKAAISENDRQFSITVGKNTATVQKVRSTQTSVITKL